VATCEEIGYLPSLVLPHYWRSKTTRIFTLFCPYQPDTLRNRWTIEIYVSLMRPCRISVERFSALTTWPKYFNLRHWIAVRKQWLGDSSLVCPDVFCPADPHHSPIWRHFKCRKLKSLFLCCFQSPGFVP